MKPEHNRRFRIGCHHQKMWLETQAKADITSSRSLAFFIMLIQKCTTSSTTALFCSDMAGVISFE